MLDKESRDRPAEPLSPAQIQRGESAPDDELEVGDIVLAPDLNGATRAWRMIKQFRE